MGSPMRLAVRPRLPHARSWRRAWHVSRARKTRAAPRAERSELPPAAANKNEEKEMEKALPSLSAPLAQLRWAAAAGPRAAGPPRRGTRRRIRRHRKPPSDAARRGRVARAAGCEGGGVREQGRAIRQDSGAARANTYSAPNTLPIRSVIITAEARGSRNFRTFSGPFLLRRGLVQNLPT